MFSLRCSCRRLLRAGGERGQGTVEAAFALPVLCLLVLLLVQPGIFLYDRMVMNAAASEACRLLSTSTDSLGSQASANEAFVRHRLASIPAQDLFHVHGESCSWDIRLSGNEDAGESTVFIGNEVKPLPLISSGMAALGLLNARGNFELRVECTLPNQPDWALSSASGISASSWEGLWLQ